MKVESSWSDLAATESEEIKPSPGTFPTVCACHNASFCACEARISYRTKDLPWTKAGRLTSRCFEGWTILTQLHPLCPRTKVDITHVRHFRYFDFGISFVQDLLLFLLTVNWNRTTKRKEERKQLLLTIYLNINLNICQTITVFNRHFRMDCL